MDEDVDETVPQGCLDEMKKSAMDVHSLVAVQENASQISQVMDCTRFSSFRRLIRVTAIVLHLSKLCEQELKVTVKEEWR